MYVCVCCRLWSSEVKARVHKTYGFFAYSLASTAGAAYMALRNNNVMKFIMARPIVVSPQHFMNRCPNIIFFLLGIE